MLKSDVKSFVGLSDPHRSTPRAELLYHAHMFVVFFCFFIVVLFLFFCDIKSHAKLQKYAHENKNTP